MSSKGRKKKDSEQQVQMVDLGLSALLSGDGVSTHAAPSSSETGPSVTNESGEADSEPPLELTLSEFEELNQAKDWGALVKLAEDKLAVVDEPEFRLWWVRGHLGAFSMPVSFLAAPLEAVCRRARDNQLPEELRSVLKETGALALSRLKEVGARDQVESLRDSLLDAGVLEVDKDEQSARVKGESLLKGPSAVAPVDRTSAEGVARVSREKLARSAFRVSAIGLMVGLALLVAAGIGGWYWFRNFLSVPVVIAEEDFISEPLSVDQLIPPLERRGAVGSLSALFYSIEHAEPSSATPDQAAPTKTADSAVSTGEQGAASLGASGMTPPSPVPEKPKPSSTDRNRKERINTRSPVEGPELKDRLRRRETRPQRDSSREPILRGPEPPMSPPGMENRKSDVFDPSGVYRVLVRTSVLATPSYSAEVVGRLEPGDRVFVEARMGRWVRLRSKRGRGGFVLAEDVAQIPQDSMGR